MIEKKVPRIKFDIDRKEQKTNVIIIKHLIVKTKTDARQKNPYVFKKSNMS